MDVRRHVRRAGNGKHAAIAIEEMLVDCERLTARHQRFVIDPKPARVCQFRGVECCSCVEFVKAGCEIWIIREPRGRSGNIVFYIESGAQLEDILSTLVSHVKKERFHLKFFRVAFGTRQCECYRRNLALPVTCELALHFKTVCAACRRLRKNLNSAGAQRALEVHKHPTSASEIC